MLKKGDKVRTQCYKHNEKVHKAWEEAIFLDSTEEFNIFGNCKTLVTEADGRTWRTREAAIIFFSKKNWYHIIGQIKKDGIYYYCDIASPSIIEDKTIKYIDYDLDLRVFPDGSFKILDRGEYQYHKRIMKYPKELDIILRSELTNLINRVRNKEFPFNKSDIDKYYEEYKKLAK